MNKPSSTMLFPLLLAVVLLAFICVSEGPLLRVVNQDDCS